MKEKKEMNGKKLKKQNIEDFDKEKANKEFLKERLICFLVYWHINLRG